MKRKNYEKLKKFVLEDYGFRREFENQKLSLTKYCKKNERFIKLYMKGK